MAPGDLFRRVLGLLLAVVVRGQPWLAGGSRLLALGGACYLEAALVSRGPPPGAALAVVAAGAGRPPGLCGVSCYGVRLGTRGLWLLRCRLRPVVCHGRGGVGSVLAWVLVRAAACLRVAAVLCRRRVGCPAWHRACWVCSRSSLSPAVVGWCGAAGWCLRRHRGLHWLELGSSAAADSAGASGLLSVSCEKCSSTPSARVRPAVTAVAGAALCASGGCRGRGAVRADVRRRRGPCWGAPAVVLLWLQWRVLRWLVTGRAVAGTGAPAPAGLLAVHSRAG